MGEGTGRTPREATGGDAGAFAASTYQRWLLVGNR